MHRYISLHPSNNSREQIEVHRAGSSREIIYTNKKVAIKAGIEIYIVFNNVSLPRFHRASQVIRRKILCPVKEALITGNNRTVHILNQINERPPHFTRNNPSIEMGGS
jgi:hypothetical protein